MSDGSEAPPDAADPADHISIAVSHIDAADRQFREWEGVDYDGHDELMAALICLQALVKQRKRANEDSEDDT